MIKEAKALHTTAYLTLDEIEKNLDGVEYIIMAEPSPSKFKDTPIHFSIFLNTKDELSKEVSEMVLDKLRAEHGIGKPTELLATIKGVGFGITEQQSAMPLLLIEQKDIISIPHTLMYVYDFLADASGYEEVKTHSLTGWSYIKN
ncbi:MAG: hypothetical protein WC144_05825 [Sulfurimonas sp.]|jgi:hypothetical protein|nr:hypothetical protein [Sulfurimonadaceae bacterium]